MNTLIISAFPACGKTYIAKQGTESQTLNYLGRTVPFSCCDSDSSKYKKVDGWEKAYVDDIEAKIGTLDFVFISQHQEVLFELMHRNIKFVLVLPDNIFSNERDRALIKQQWFGRIALRDNAFIQNKFSNWAQTLSENYDRWTSLEHIQRYAPNLFFLLKQNEYLSDILPDLYLKKESYTEHYCGKRS